MKNSLLISLIIFSIGFNLRINAQVDTLNLPFIDDFYSYNSYPDTLKWEKEGGSLLNNGYSISSASYGAISFDGIQSDGVPYAFVDYQPTVIPEFDDSIDFLSTKPIDLSMVTNSSNLAFSFFWQKGGASPSNAPELEEGDSLHLYFFKRDSTWEKVWPLGSNITDTAELSQAKPGDPFNYKFISITDSVKYFHKGFKSKFTTYGAANGPFDLWNVDYIYLDTNRVLNSRILDFAFNKKPTSLLKDYTSAPVTHIIESGEDIISDEVFSSMINISDNGLLFLEDTAFGNVSESFRMVNIDTILAKNEERFIGVDEETKIIWKPNKTSIYNAINTLNDGDPINLESTFINKTPDTIPYNDTIIGSTYLYNYYAYDDGSAESGVGIFNFGQIAIKYNNLKTDTLEYIDIYFPKMEFNLLNTAINLKVWQNLEDVDGASSTDVLLTSASIVRYQDGLNHFYHYKLPSPLILEPGTFYIGFEQNIQTRIYIGWDKSTDHSDKLFFQGSTGEWIDYQSSDNFAFGSPMIRPRFGEPDDDPLLSIVEMSSKPLIQLFPNPTDSELNITGNFSRVMVYNITGKVILEKTTNKKDIETIDVSNLTSGIYVIRLIGENFSDTQKFIKY